MHGLQRCLQCCILGCHTYRGDCRWVQEISHFFLMKSLSISTLTGITNLPWPRCRLNQKFRDMETDRGESLGIAGYSESPHSRLSTSSHFPRNRRGSTRFSPEARSRCVFNGEYCVDILKSHNSPPRMLLKLPYTGGELVTRDQWRTIMDAHFPRTLQEN